MAHLEGVEVRTMADLLDKGKLAVLGGLLSKTYDGLMIGEKLHTGQMTAPERRIYEKGMNPNFWRDLPNRKQRTYYRTKFEQLVSRHGGLMRETVGQLISGRVDFLLKSWDVLPDHPNQKLGRFTPSYTLLKPEVVQLELFTSSTPPTTRLETSTVTLNATTRAHNTGVFSEAGWS